jgi:hypothetical protein
VDNRTTRQHDARLSQKRSGISTEQYLTVAGTCQNDAPIRIVRPETNVPGQCHPGIVSKVLRIRLAMTDFADSFRKNPYGNGLADLAYWA